MPRCSRCGQEIGERDYAASYPFDSACDCPPEKPEPINYTGCECHDSCNESWAKVHMGIEVEKQVDAKPRTVLDYRQLGDGTWKLKEERVGDEASR